jgi:hypothetical protein
MLGVSCEPAAAFRCTNYMLTCRLLRSLIIVVKFEPVLLIERCVVAGDLASAASGQETSETKRASTVQRPKMASHVVLGRCQ